MGRLGVIDVIGAERRLEGDERGSINKHSSNPKAVGVILASEDGGSWGGWAAGMEPDGGWFEKENF